MENSNETDEERRSRLRAKLRGKIRNKRNQTGRGNYDTSTKNNSDHQNDRYGLRKSLGHSVTPFLEQLNESIDTLVEEHPISERQEMSGKITKKIIKMMKSGQNPFTHLDKAKAQLEMFAQSQSPPIQLNAAELQGWGNTSALDEVDEVEAPPRVADDSSDSSEGEGVQSGPLLV
tara:strand:+ start:551 stop:1075 length:525 start_codon:yes stop_codon:yes gene_type:complete